MCVRVCVIVVVVACLVSLQGFQRGLELEMVCVFIFQTANSSFLKLLGPVLSLCIRMYIFKVCVYLQTS